MPLVGCFSPLGDKSISHRIALISILGHGNCCVKNYSSGEDCISSLAAFEKLGGIVKHSPKTGLINITGLAGFTKVEPLTKIDCGNSGTTIRLLMGILSNMPDAKYLLDGDQYLRKRPMERIASPLRTMGANITTNADRAPIEISGKKLSGIEYTLPVPSAQLKSAILLAGIRATSPTTIIEPVASRDHTELMLKSFGVDIKKEQSAITLQPGSINLPAEFYVPGDPSSAAFFLTAATLIEGSDVVAKGILLNPTRIHFIEVLKRMGANIEIAEQGAMPESWGDIRVKYNGRLCATDIEPDEVPSLVDEIPILALAAALAKGKSTYKGISELRIKETDRVKAIEEELKAYEVMITSTGSGDTDSLVINGLSELHSPIHAVDSRGDHRMAMMLRLAQVISGEDGIIKDEECTAVSYPNFLNDLDSLLGI